VSGSVPKENEQARLETVESSFEFKCGVQGQVMGCAVEGPKKDNIIHAVKVELRVICGTQSDMSEK
jgi:hypothetical protein